MSIFHCFGADAIVLPSSAKILLFAFANIVPRHFSDDYCSQVMTFLVASMMGIVRCWQTASKYIKYFL